MDTLAAAYAEDGQFDEAVKTQTRASRLLRENRDVNEKNELPGYERRRSLYRANKVVGD